ncbi:MAG: maleate cis-trans isomerase family protein [Candidatus Limnocylindrales bacterium]
MTTWIGRIEPSMWMEGPWWHDVLPEDVRLAVLSLGVRRLRDEDLERAHAQILDKVEALDAEGVDVINVGGSPVVSLHGHAGHERLLTDIAARTKRPFVTSLQAECEALRLVGGSSVLIASPYPIAQTERRVIVLADEGITTTAHSSLDIERTRDITQLEPDAIADQAIALASAHPDGDVIYLPCGSLPVVAAVERIESETGRPVVTNVTAQVYACLVRAGYDQPIQGYGRLLRSLGDQPALVAGGAPA